MTSVNDMVLIYYEDKPLVFARIEGISADVKAGWYDVRLLLLQTPLQVVTWILREAYINGGEFSMNGKRMRLEKVIAPADPQGTVNDAVHEQVPQKSPKDREGAKVISLAELKKKQG
jgi:hypothetical protein